MDPSKRNLIIFDDLMTEAKCDQRIADLFTKGSHHRNISIVYLTQNVFPQGRACRDIALKIVNEYDQEIPQSQTADNPVAP